MKKIIFSALFLAGIAGNVAIGQDAYYWYKGQKVSLTKDETRKFVIYADAGFQKRASAEKSGLKIDAMGSYSSSASNIPYKSSKGLKGDWAVVKGPNNIISHPTDATLEYEAPFYKKGKNEIAISNLFYIKLKSSADLAKLEKLAAKTNVEIIGSNAFMPEWYTLAAHKGSKGNALELANLFYESGQFSDAAPDFMQDYRGACVNDTYFSQQWGLKNTGQVGTSGNDIRACDAWTTTTGSSSIIVAVVDQGIQLNHPDMTNLVSQSYDTHTGTSPSKIRGNHGTACAGIVGANRNNSKGVSGVAPGCKLMSVSDSLTFTPDASQRLANGINFAWQNGAAVISNSWAGSDFQSPILDDAITNALNLGRNGLGTILVFATGNQDEEVRYPANSNPDILAVGAASPCGERKSPISCDGKDWGSNSGPELDLIAPGVLIPTTDRTGSNGYTANDYRLDFGGTSAATPHVAGVAALILSVNPNLTRKQVADIIESTARKTGGYSYVNTSGRPNGTWNWEAGHGLLDANAAVLKAKTTIGNYLTKFSVPRTTALPTIYKQSSHVHVLGTGGPNLSGFFNSVFNWNLSWNSLMQFSLERNSSPYYTELKNFSTYTFNQSQPKIIINNSTGWAGLAGTYYINIHNNNIVLVSQSGQYALYFSNSSTPPNVRMEELNADLENEEALHSQAYPNPFATNTEIGITEPSNVMVVNSKGVLMEQFEASENIALGQNYASGIYLVKVVSGSKVRKFSIIKE